MINKGAGARPRKRGKLAAVPRAAGLGGVVQAGLETNAQPKPLPMLSNFRDSSLFAHPRSPFGTSSRPDNGRAGRSCEPVSFQCETKQKPRH
jgi:hypothetical protein